MKHKHYDMIVAKAANMELTILVKFGKEWMISGLNTAGEIISFDSRYEYFLCLPQHKKECLHWLNGGNAQTDRSFGEFVEIEDAFKCKFKWWADGWFMQEDYKSRIKPKKEKRWMIYSERPLSVEIFSDESVCDTVFSSKLPTENKQKIEIEVEV